MFNRLLLSALVGLSLPFLGGCGGGTTTVSGTVSLDGQPVKSGSIAFVDPEGKRNPAGAVIQDGRFQADVPPGKYRLELTGQKVVGQRTQKDFEGKDETLDITAELFPEKFNVSSELIEDIPPGSHTLELDLKSK